METVENNVPNKEEKIQETHRRDASTAMVLGIIGDCLVWYPIIGIAGLFLCVFALINSNKNRDFANANGIFEHGNNVAGRWCGIGGIVVGSIMLVLYLVAFALILLIALGFIQNSGVLSQLNLGFIPSPTPTVIP